MNRRSLAPFSLFFFMKNEKFEWFSLWKKSWSSAIVWRGVAFFAPWVIFSSHYEHGRSFAEAWGDFDQKAKGNFDFLRHFLRHGYSGMKKKPLMRTAPNNENATFSA